MSGDGTWDETAILRLIRDEHERQRRERRRRRARRYRRAFELLWVALLSAAVAGVLLPATLSDRSGRPVAAALLQYLASALSLASGLFSLQREIGRGLRPDVPWDRPRDDDSPGRVR